MRAALPLLLLLLVSVLVVQRGMDLAIHICA